MRKQLRGLAGLSEFVDRAGPELAANAMLCAVNQAAYLLKRQLESQGETISKIANMGYGNAWSR